MKNNYLFDRVCKECTEFEDKVSDGWWTYPVAKSLSGVYIDIMGDDGDCYDGIYVTSVRQAKVFLKGQLRFLGVNQMYRVGDTVMLVKIVDNEERGKLTDKVPLRTKGVVSYVFKDSVIVDGYIWYFDEIKLVIRGEINES